VSALAQGAGKPGGPAQRSAARRPGRPTPRAAGGGGRVFVGQDLHDLAHATPPSALLPWIPPKDAILAGIVLIYPSTYSPECGEGRFPELRPEVLRNSLYVILGSSTCAINKLRG
jgi:hypothetical protein